MKKVLLVLSLVAAAFTAQAQDESLKADAGNITLELGFAPFSYAPISMGDNTIRGRYFLSQSLAARAGFHFDHRVERPNKETTNSSSTFGFRPGIEKHFAGTGRLSPYVGAELELSSRSSKQIVETPTRRVETINDNGYTRFGLGLLAGADYYFTRHAYLGVEFSYGLGYHKNKDILKTDNDPIKGGSSLYIGSGVNSFIRLGFVLI